MLAVRMDSSRKGGLNSAWASLDCLPAETRLIYHKSTTTNAASRFLQKRETYVPGEHQGLRAPAVRRRLTRLVARQVICVP